MDKDSKRIDFWWRYQPIKATTDGVLISYIKSNLVMPSKEMILQALRPYWLPLAYQEKENVDPIFLERLFKSAIYALEKHTLYLCDQAKMDYPLHILGKKLSDSSQNLPSRLCRVEEVIRCDNKNSSAAASSHFDNDKFTTDDLFASMGGEDFDDLGFS